MPLRRRIELFAISHQPWVARKVLPPLPAIVAVDLRLRRLKLAEVVAKGSEK